MLQRLKLFTSLLGNTAFFCLPKVSYKLIYLTFMNVIYNRLNISDLNWKRFQTDITADIYNLWPVFILMIL